MAKLIKTSGKITEVSVETLAEKQKAVGGWIELVYIPDNKVLIVNEEGLLLNLPYNRVASELSNTLIVGDVLLVENSEIS